MLYVLLCIFRISIQLTRAEEADDEHEALFQDIMVRWSLK